MQRTSKISLLVFLSILAVMTVFAVGKIPQSVAYHNFCDKRSFIGMANFLNVVSNLPFVVIGIAGLFLLRRSAPSPAMAAIYSSLCIGIILTGLGSAYYHFSPDNDTLVFDRLPMTMVFMSLVASIIGEAISKMLAVLLLPPLVLTGIGSVLWWHYTESGGIGDLRLYVLVQYYPMILIPAILLLFPSSTNKREIGLLVWAFTWYLLAKVLEHFDCSIYSSLGFISGHSLKHLAAAVSTWCLVKKITRSGQPVHAYSRTPGTSSNL